MDKTDQKPPSSGLEGWWDQGGHVPQRPLLLLAGPCVLESEDTNLQIAEFLAAATAAAGMPFVFKASFDKANRSSVHSDRGPGLESGLATLSEIRNRLGVPIMTDVHEPAQAEACGEVVDVLQVPAFLCRQTDLLVACGRTGRPVAVKKGQFLSPAEMRNVLEKLRDAGCPRMMATERGTFFGYQRLVNDFIGLGDLQDLAAEFGAPVCFDVTHSTQLPGGSGTTTAGRPERAPMLARAAVAAGVDALFLECHPDPANARSDASTVLPLDAIPSLLDTLSSLRKVVSEGMEAANK
ncbi:MAG: 3-deoxy-8-phosphooctulonate synthase [Phycisphaerales bacterium]|nr:3-deoxy-8-phosphooctulonate synthase [Phycisphaerales bacterium]